MSLLSTSGLSRSYSGLRAVDDVDFTLPEGEIRALIGPNGAGKTTFVGMLSGRIAASSGTVRFAGQDISRLPAHRRIRLGIGYCFQITSVFPGLSAAENVRLAAAAVRPTEAVEAEVAAALARVGLEGREGSRAADLSYGHQRLLEIAMGLAQAPRLLILDEPSQGLDDDETRGVIDLIRGLAPATTVLLIEHNMDVVMATADSISVLVGGQLLAEGTPEAIRADVAVQDAYLGRA